MSVSGELELCLRRVFVSNVMSSTRLNWREILAEVRNESVSGAKMGVWRWAFWLRRVALRRPWMPAFAGKTVVLVWAFWPPRVALRRPWMPAFAGKTVVLVRVVVIVG